MSNKFKGPTDHLFKPGNNANPKGRKKQSELFKLIKSRVEYEMAQAVGVITMSVQDIQLLKSRYDELSPVVQTAIEASENNQWNIMKDYLQFFTGKFENYVDKLIPEPLDENPDEILAMSSDARKKLKEVIEQDARREHYHETEGSSL